MSLRRSARVQALPLPKFMTENSLKRAFAATKPRSGPKLAKELDHPIASSLLKPEDSTKENSTAGTVSNSPNVTSKRRKVETRRLSASSPELPNLSSSVATITDGLPAVVATRPVEPRTTNAPLISPTDGHIVTAHPPILPLPAGLPSPLATTLSVLDDAVAHLTSADTTGRLARVISAYPCPVFAPDALNQPLDPFRSLSSGIISQQVSGAAATSIKNKFIALFTDSAPAFPPPAVVAVTSIPTLRSAGLSQRKAEYIQGLAEKFVSGELSAELLAKASDEEVMERLVAVRGLGRWSVEMFSLFDMKRMDVFSTGDLGIQ